MRILLSVGDLISLSGSHSGLLVLINFSANPNTLLSLFTVMS